MIMIMNVDMKRVNTVQSCCGFFFFVNWLQNKKNLHDFVDCVHALQFNAPGRLSQVNPGVQKISPKDLSCPFSSLPFPPLLLLPPAAGLDLARDLDSPGPRFSHHVSAWENRPNHSTASAGSVLTQSPGEAL